MPPIGKLSTPQGVDPIEDAGWSPATGACKPLAIAAEHRGCVEVRHEQASELALVVALPRYRLDAATHDGLEQSHAPQIDEINAAPMLDLAR
jgi:hypothetical protein